MVKRGASIGFYGLFGRSHDMKLLDASLKQCGLTPNLISEAVKLATVSLMSTEQNPEPADEDYGPVGALMCFLSVGSEYFADINGSAQCQIMINRLEQALESGKGQDASIILLMLHAGSIHPDLSEQYDISSDEDE